MTETTSALPAVLTPGTELPSAMERLRCRLPVMSSEHVDVEHFEVGENSLENMRLLINGGRQTRPGRYSRLLVDGRLWMSDTDAECCDHIDPVIAADRLAGVRWRSPVPTPSGRGLVNGLGLGCIVAALLDVLEHVDVVEINPHVAELVGGWYREQYGDRVTIHVDDAYSIKWPTGTTWDVAWHDIWPDLTTDNLPEMGKLHRRYGRRVGWQGSWGKALLQRERDRERRSGGWW